MNIIGRIIDRFGGAGSGNPLVALMGGRGARRFFFSAKKTRERGGVEYK